MEHVVQRLPRRWLERVARVVGSGNKSAMPDVGRHAQQLRDLLLVPQVQTCPRGAQSPSTCREHVAPRGWQQRSLESGLTPGPQLRHADARDDVHRHLTHVLPEIGHAVPYPSLHSAALRIIGEQGRGRARMS